MLDIFQIIETCAPTVAPSTMMQIISVESEHRATAIGYKITRDGKEYRLTKQPQNIGEARSWATWLLKHGYRFDAGIAQINSNNFAYYGLTPANVFDACTNIAVSGKILTTFYLKAVLKYGEGQQALLAAFSAYQSGNFHTGFSTGYVQKVATKKIPSRTKFLESIPPLEALEVIQLDMHDTSPNQ